MRTTQYNVMHCSQMINAVPLAIGAINSKITYISKEIVSLRVINGVIKGSFA